MKNTCPKCKNQLYSRKVLLKVTGPKCTPLYKQETYCSYCEWKGDAGPGAQLKAIVKEINGPYQTQTFWNHPDKLKKWAWYATEELDHKADQDRLRADALRLIAQGKWRGDISEYWRKNYYHLRDQLQDLYL